MVKLRKISFRKCTGCGAMKNKKELLRIIKSDTGEISLDSTGKKSGRGAYVCPSEKCLAMAYKRKGLDRSLKQVIPIEIYESLKAALYFDG